MISIKFIEQQLEDLDVRRGSSAWIEIREAAFELRENLNREEMIDYIEERVDNQEAEEFRETLTKGKMVDSQFEDME